MAAPRQQKPQTVYTEDEYFQFAETAEERWEFLPNGLSLTNGSTLGIMRAMHGGMPDHSLIATNIGSILNISLRQRGCRVFGPDLRIQTGDGVNTYPDVSVVCAKLELIAKRRDTILNPILIVEVLSKSTGNYDKGEKFIHYQTIPTLQDYMLVSQDQVLVILHSRTGDHWGTRIITGADSTLYLPSVDLTLALADVYALVEFEPEMLSEE